MSNDKRAWMRNAALASSIGIVLVVSTVMGYGLGLLLKRLFHFGEWVVMVGLLIGIVAGFVEMFRIVLQISKEEDR